MTAATRAFFAIQPPAGVRHDLAALVDDGSLEGLKLRRVPEGNLHLTIRFLGLVSPEIIDVLVAEIDAGSGSLNAIDLSISEVEAFPRRRPRVIAATVYPDDALLRLEAFVESAVTRSGLLPRDRTFRPHVTLAKLNQSPRPVPCLPAQVSLDFRADELVLFKSELHQNGARYSRLHTTPLIG